LQKSEELGKERTTLEGLQRKLQDHEERLTRLERLSQAEPQKIAKATSIREFLLEKQPGSDVEKTFVIGYFLERHRGFSSFNTRDLGEGFREAKENVPANVNLAVIGNVQKGYFMEAKEKKDGLKAWTLTNSGVGYFESPKPSQQGGQ
jgi:hypothetical protein